MISNLSAASLKILSRFPEEEKEPDAEEYPEYEVGKWYYAGDKISFNGSNYVCIAPDGAVCVWSPADYPAYWEELI